MTDDWRQDLCRCEGRHQHIHCPWGSGFHVHYVDDDGNNIEPPPVTQPEGDPS